MSKLSKPRTPDDWCGEPLYGWWLNEVLNTDEYDPSAIYTIEKKDKNDEPENLSND